MKKLIIAALISLAVIPNALSQRLAPQVNNTDLQTLKFQQFNEYLNTLYVDTLNNSKLVEDAIKSILSELDPHSSYSSTEEMKSINESFGGSFSGIGVEFDVIGDTIVVVNTISGGPSESSGILPNDRIITVDGKNAVGTSRADVPKLLRGTKGSIVTLGVARRGVKKPMTFRITRDNIPIHTIDAAYIVEPGIGYIKVNRFAETTMAEFRDAFNNLGKINALILDLRGNGGGLMDQAISLSEFFLPYGSVIVSTEGRNVRNTSYKSRKQGEFTSGNLVVLIDSSSASGSEIVAGAIQDWDRGIIIGQPSFGKGLVQRQVPLIDGSAVRITVARYHTPSGRVIQRPFEQGKTDEYYIDHIKRTYDSNYADSVNSNAPIYRTLRSGRKVPGGGGIHPDILIQIDTTQNYSYWNNLTREGVVNQYINTYLETHRNKLLARYPNFDSYAKNFMVTPEMLTELAALGKTRGIVPPADKTLESLPDMRYYIKAIIARKLWDTNEYFRIINDAGDEEFSKAIEVIYNWPTYSKLLK